MYQGSKQALRGTLFNENIYVRAGQRISSRYTKTHSSIHKGRVWDILYWAQVKEHAIDVPTMHYHAILHSRHISKPRLCYMC